MDGIEETNVLGIEKESSLSLSSWMTRSVVYILSLLLLWVIVRFLFSTLSNLLKGYPPWEDSKKPVDPFINGVQYAVSYWTEKGGRPYQEDRHQQLKGRGADDSSLYAVFDGHGGSRAAQYCKDHLLDYALNDPCFLDHPGVALRKAFIRTDAEFSALARQPVLSDGTTAVTAVIHNGRIYVANAGDSRAIIVQKGGRTRHMSVDHKPNREDEEERIKKLGGKIIHWGRWRVQGVLAVSRAIGDVTLQPYVTCEPEILEKQIDIDDEYLVLASDGLWDVLRNEEVSRLVLEATRRGFLSSSRELCTEALRIGSTDNVTVLVIDLRNKFKNSSPSS